jgi:hypothetical protein
MTRDRQAWNDGGQTGPAIFRVRSRVVFRAKIIAFIENGRQNAAPTVP